MNTHGYTIEDIAKKLETDIDDVAWNLDYEGFDLEAIEWDGGLAMTTIISIALLDDGSFCWNLLDDEAISLIEAIRWYIGLLQDSYGVTEIALYYNGVEYDASDMNGYMRVKEEYPEAYLIASASSLRDIGAVYNDDGVDLVDWSVVHDYVDEIIESELTCIE